MHTNVWTNATNGHRYEEGERGNLLNSRPVDERPDWVSGDPDLVFGPLVEWFGGECPVPAAAEVRCIFRARRPYIGLAICPDLPERGKASMWQHAPFPGRSNPGSDIVAFQARVG